MDVTAFLHEIQSQPTYTGQIVHLREVPARAGQFAAPSFPLADETNRMLTSRGIERLYTHQVQALEAWHAGDNILVTTGTASGKSLCYTIPILETLRQDPTSTFLLLFPTKALCQDQFRAFAQALTEAGMGECLAGVFDGDTPSKMRRKLRDHGRVLFTNPDMLHAGLMPQHARWAGFLSRLRLLVVDEVHVYSGIFGSNMGNLFRRFFRLCAHYGADPQLAACSATIGNPRELTEELTGRPFTLIDQDGSPRGKRTYIFWNPPQVRATTWRSRRSANVEAHDLMALLISRGVRTITFSKAKMTAEMIYRYVYDALQGSMPHLAMQLATYRGGYLPEERREIERRLFSGELLGVSTTRALELGIDIGGLDACIIVGYPGTLASYFQQTGRAGRAREDALAILVGLDTPANQYVMGHPDYLFGRPIEEAVTDRINPFVITGHLRCAAHELALRESEVSLFGPYAPLVLRLLEDNQKLMQIEDRWYHTAAETPQHEVSLRSVSDANVVIEDVDTGLILGELDKYDAPPILHPEAIYMHQGDTYLVLSLDLERNIARVKRVEVDYYTQPIGGTDVHHIDHCLREKPFGTGTTYWGEVTSRFHNWGYEKVRFYELDAISVHGVELPDFLLETMACWIVPPEPLLEDVRRAGYDVHNGLRAIGYATRMILPLFMTCDTADFSHSIGSVNSPWQTIFIYERYPRGLGFTEKAYTLLHRILPAVLEMIAQCPCEDGCPCCVGKPLRQETVWNVERGEASIPSKHSAMMILRGVLGDGTQLDHPDTLAMTDTEAADEIRLERMVRRRLERMREPQLRHLIAPKVETEYPDPEHEQSLATADVERRHDRRVDAEKALRKRLAKRLEGDGLSPNTPNPGPPPGMTKRHGVNPPTAFPVPPKEREEPEQPVTLGDSLAAKARRLKKRSQEQE